jgi:hypothetical protein
MAMPLRPARGERDKLGVLLGCLLAALVLLVVQGPALSFGGEEGRGQARPCWARLPTATSISPEDLGRLRAQVNALVAPTVGRAYEQGYVSADALFSDDEPVDGSSERRAGGAGYEQRWFALDRHGGEDDVVADVWEFSTPRRAGEALALAVDPSCRNLDRQAPGTSVVAPPGAQDISWTNPDGARQWDSLLVRGRLLYRVGDVPPARAPREWAAITPVTFRTVNALACALPNAGCLNARAALADDALATGVSGTIGPGARGRPTRAQAAAFVRAVSIKPYDVPGFASLGRGTHSGEHTSPASGRCEIKARPGSVLASGSPRAYLHRSRGRYEWVASTVAVLADPALAAREIALFGSASARACARENVRGWLGGIARRRALRAGAVRVRTLSPEVPRSYRGSWRYRASALQLALLLEYLPPAHRTPVGYSAGSTGPVAVPVYVEAVAIAYGRALITLTTVSLERPYFPEGKRYLESVLLARAEAWDG